MIDIFGDKATSSEDGISSQVNLKIRVDGEGRSITEPINISQQCIVYRGGRQGCDLIRDEVMIMMMTLFLMCLKLKVDDNLERELEQLKTSQGLLGQTSQQMGEQVMMILVMLILLLIIFRREIMTKIIITRSQQSS